MESELLWTIRLLCKVYCVKNFHQSCGVKRNWHLKTSAAISFVSSIIKQDFRTGANVSHIEDEFVSGKKISTEIVFWCFWAMMQLWSVMRIWWTSHHKLVILYIVDDWVNTKINTPLLRIPFGDVSYQRFRHIMDRASGLLSICQYMTDEYKCMYGKTYYPFHNPVISPNGRL